MSVNRAREHVENPLDHSRAAEKARSVRYFRH
jgi:hypothetical protein